MAAFSGGIDYWTYSPLFGHGLGSLHRMPDRYFGGLGCHNTHVMLLGEVGILGFIPYLVFLFVFARASWTAKTTTVRNFCVSFFLVFIAVGWVAHGMLEDRNLNILLGVCFGLLSLDKSMAHAARQNYQRNPMAYPAHAMNTGRHN